MDEKLTQREARDISDVRRFVAEHKTESPDATQRARMLAILDAERLALVANRKAQDERAADLEALYVATKEYRETILNPLSSMSDIGRTADAVDAVLESMKVK
jgi:hypothetical protein